VKKQNLQNIAEYKELFFRERL